jgi:hypothetical protein
LYVRIRERDIAFDKAVVTYLRAARVREQLRTEAVQQVCSNALTIIGNTGATPIVLKGVAMAETVYPEPSTRHCHDLDILLTHDGFDSAVAALSRAGFARVESPPSASVESVWMVDGSRFPLGLHASLYRVAAWNAASLDVMSESVVSTITGVEARVLTPGDSLLHVCCSGLAAGSWFSPCWTADACFLLRKHGDAIDWSELVERAQSASQAHATAIAFDYLNGELRAGIPDWVISALHASPMTSVEVDTLWSAALLSVRGRKLGFMRRSTTPVDGAHAAWWLLTRSHQTVGRPNA